MLIARWGLVGQWGGGVHHTSGVDLRKGSPRHDGGNERARSLSVLGNIFFRRPSLGIEALCLYAATPL